ncbi:MAG: helix-turn-helix transcriptional regulator [Chitinophagaceae bacterium]|nr:helix-turn-helix transcriptional regulator [Chitinophagaceae bacterium]
MSESPKTEFELYVIDKVRERRMELGLSQDDIAIILNTTRGFIGQIESRKNSAKYNLNHLNILAAELNCSPKDFLPEKPI